MILPRYRDSFILSVLIVLAACRPEVAPGDDNSSIVAANPSAQNAAAPVAERFRYDGLCEASAAAILDENHFAVASDDSETLRIYRRGQAGSTGEFKHPEVTDIEGAARIGSTIFWLTSHSLNKDREDKPKRKVLFATNIAKGPSIAAAGTHFIQLRERLAAHLGGNETGLSPWLNIEGLAGTPEGHLLVGLRGLNDNEPAAFILRVDDPSALVGLTPSAVDEPAGSRTAVFRLNLGGRGIRSMERVGEGARSYLILAGPQTDTHDIDFKLFWWNGAGETVTAGPAVKFGDMVPEALIAWPDGEIQILGDNGSNCSDKKVEPNRPPHFPSLSLKL